MTSDHHDPGRRGADDPLEDLFADVESADLSDDDAVLPDLTDGAPRRTTAGDDAPDVPDDAEDAPELPDLAAGRQGSLEDLGGDWEAPAPPPVADADDDWTPVVPAPAAGRSERRAARAARRGRRGHGSRGRGPGPVARASAAAEAASGQRGEGGDAGAGHAAATGVPDEIPGPRSADDGQGLLTDPGTGVPPVEPSTLFSPEDGTDGKPKRPLTAEERLQHAITLAYRHLSKRDRTVAEVRAHLEKKSIDAASVQGAVAELVEVGYLDDARYAERFVEDKRRLEGWGALRIEQGLRKTGLDGALIDAALADDPLRDDEDELAVEALEQRLRGAAPDGDRGRQKALRMLATKGYALETAYAAVRTYERRCAERADH